VLPTSSLHAAAAPAFDKDKIARDIAALLQIAEQAMEVARDMTLHLEWQPKIGSWPGAGSSIPARFFPSSDHALTLDFELRAKAVGDKPAGLDVSCRLDAFRLFIGYAPPPKLSDGGVLPENETDLEAKSPITLRFRRFAFRKEAGKKTDVDVVFGGITFGGPLAFLETLRRIIPLDGFSDPPSLEVGVDGVRAGFTLTVPDVAVGMFSLENIKISAELSIPFLTDGSVAKALTFKFEFCDRDHPFLCTVAMLGGGGYFLLEATPAGIQKIEASICVGAQLAMDFFGIAHGSVSITAGITFTYDATDGTSISGFLRLHGELDVLGLISVVIDLRITMTYEVATKKLIAKAELHIEVSIMFFSTSVTIPYETHFCGSNGDPTLVDLMLPPDSKGAVSTYWSDYCAAYAAAT
jgi:hypothetical protein